MKTRPKVLPFWVILLVGSLCLTIGLSAQAQALAAMASCDADEECSRLANEAIDFSKAGRFEDAQLAYKAAYAITPDTKLLFNLARVLHKAKRLAEAITYYQKYLDTGAEGNEEQRQKAQQRMDEASSEQAFLSAPVTSSQPPVQSVSLVQPLVPPSPRESSHRVAVYRKWWLWTVVGVAVVGAAVGIGLGLTARRPDLTGYADAHPFGDPFGR